MDRGLVRDYSNRTLSEDKNHLAGEGCDDEILRGWEMGNIYLEWKLMIGWLMKLRSAWILN